MQTLPKSILGLAEKDSSYQEAAYRFIIPKAQKIYLSLSHRDSWKELVERAQALGDAEADGILACLFQTAGDKRLLRADV